MRRRGLHSALAACLGIGLVATGACKSNRHAEIEGMEYVQADGLIEVPKGESIVVRAGGTLTLPAEDSVKLALERNMRWSEVKALRKQVIDAGKTPYFMAASERKVGAIELYEELSGTPIDVFVSAEGKLCVSPPGTPEAKCVQRGDRTHVDRAFTRELVREAIKAYNIRDILVDVTADIEWADVVRAVDGARTCCGDKKVTVRVK